MIHASCYADTDRCVHVHVVGTWKHAIHCSPKCGLNGSSNQGTDNKRLLKLLTQENVLVGGFFGISGYVAAYTTTNLESAATMPRSSRSQSSSFGRRWNPMQDSARPQTHRLFNIWNILLPAKTKWKHMAIRHRSSKFKSNSETCCRSLQMHSQCFLGTCRFVQAQGERQDQPHISAYCQSFV